MIILHQDSNEKALNIIKERDESEEKELEELRN
jgi:hypothetical protein